MNFDELQAKTQAKLDAQAADQRKLEIVGYALTILIVIGIICGVMWVCNYKSSRTACDDEFQRYHRVSAECEQEAQDDLRKMAEEKRRQRQQQNQNK